MLFIAFVISQTAAIATQESADAGAPLALALFTSIAPACATELTVTISNNQQIHFGLLSLARPVDRVGLG